MADETNDAGLTPNEQAEVDAAKAAPVVAAAEPVVAAATVVEPVLAEAKPDATAALAAAAEKLGSVAERLAARAETPAPVVEATPARDFDAEKAALREQREKGEIDEVEFEKAYEKVTEAKLEAAFEAKLDARSKLETEQRAQDRWEGEVRSFGAIAENRSLFENPAHRVVFDAMLKEAGTALPKGTYQQWLDHAKAKTFEAFNIKIDGKDPAAAIAAATKAREAAAGAKPAQGIDNAPTAGADRGSEAADWMQNLDKMPVSDLEDALARLPADKLAQYLESAPGGYKDNPRAA